MDVPEQKRESLKTTCPACNQPLEECKCEGAKIVAAETTVTRDLADMTIAGSQTTDPGERTIGNYSVVSLLGKGGMGCVYKARHRILGKTVAIKMLHAEGLSSETTQRRFLNEARSASQVKHQNLASVHDFGITEEGEPYLVMDYVEGTSLSSRVKDSGKLPANRAIPIFKQICAGLVCIHRSGIVHRDLKPSNVILSSIDDGSEHVTIVDFGIAKVLASEGAGSALESMTKTGEVFGSPHYMSPEQGLGYATDTRSDIYSFGCLMFAVLTGRPAFDGEPLQILYKQINEPIRFDANSDVPELLRDIVLKCVEKSPQDRFQTADDLLRALENAQAGKATPGVKNVVAPPEKSEQSSGIDSTTSGTSGAVAQAGGPSKALILAAVVLIAVLAGYFGMAHQTPTPNADQQTNVNGGSRVQSDEPPEAPPEPANAPQRFTFNNLGDPNQHREWVKIDAQTWQERAPDGQLVNYKILRRSMEKGFGEFPEKYRPGTIVRGQQAALADIFIPDYTNEDKWAAIRDAPNGKWRNVQPINFE